MSHWQDTPPAPTEFAGIRLIRVPARSAYEGLITCSNMVGRATHFANRRTQPCEEESCELCLAGKEPRWHGYISIFNPASHRHAVLELTALAAVDVYEFFKRHGSLRGASIKATRQGNAINAPVHCYLSTPDIDLRTLPPSVNLRAFLCSIWNIPYEPDQADALSPIERDDIEAEKQITHAGKNGRPLKHATSNR